MSDVNQSPLGPTPVTGAGTACHTAAPPLSTWSGRFDGQIILITGAEGGLGSAARERLEAEGATVIATDAVAATDDANTITLDVRDRAAWDKIIEHIIAEHGRLDAALFCHGIQGPEERVDNMNFAAWQRTLDVNLNGCFHGLAAILPYMAAQEYGRVAILSSIAAREGNPMQAAYSASKAAVVSLVKTAAKEVADRNVMVNSIAPSMFETPISRDLSPERNAMLLARVPMGRIGQPSEFAALSSWLLSRENSYMTGQTLDLSGGRNTA